MVAESKAYCEQVLLCRELLISIVNNFFAWK